MALDFLDRCRFLATAGGDTGQFIQSSAVTGFLTLQQAGAVDGATYTISSEIDDLSQWEVARGPCDTGLGVVHRNVIVKSSNSGNRVTFSSAPKVRVGGPLAQDMPEALIANVTATNTPSVSTGSFDATIYREIVITLEFAFGTMAVDNGSVYITIDNGSVNQRDGVFNGTTFSNDSFAANIRGIGIANASGFFCHTQSLGDAQIFQIATNVGFTSTTTITISSEDGVADPQDFSSVTFIVSGTRRP